MTIGHTLWKKSSRATRVCPLIEIDGRSVVRYAGMMRRTAPLILVVDDDASAARELTTWLFSQGFNAVSAASCLEGHAVLGAIAIEGLIGHLALQDGSLFTLAQALRAQRTAVVVGYADVDVRPPPELDACFIRPLDLDVLRDFLAGRFRRGGSGEHPKTIPHGHSVPPARTSGRRRR